MNNPDSKTLLRDGFDFDLYANQLWLPVILEKGDEAERSIFQHILSASQIWIVRFAGTSPIEPPTVEVSEKSLHTLHENWLDAVDRLEYTRLIEYTSLRGTPASCAFGDIARHVVNHGTYHRGQLREMFGAKGLDFPETDFLPYALGRSLQL